MNEGDKGKESKRVDICICITDSLCCISETNTTLSINYTPIKINLKRKRKDIILGEKMREEMIYFQ